MGIITRVFVYVFLATYPSCCLSFSDHFESWLLQNYGQEQAEELFFRRKALGSGYSFGGKPEIDASGTQAYQPVLFIHGILVLSN